MTIYDYKVIPAPSRGLKARGVKSAEARFAFALQEAINELARQGWEYVRAETLPSEERQGLTGTTTTFRNVLVFRKELDPATDETVAPEPAALLEAPEPSEDAPHAETSHKDALEQTDSSDAAEANAPSDADASEASAPQETPPEAETKP